MVQDGFETGGMQRGRVSGPPCRCAYGASFFGAVLQHTSCGDRKNEKPKDQRRPKENDKKGKERNRTRKKGTTRRSEEGAKRENGRKQQGKRGTRE